MGRPTKYKSEYCVRLVEHMRQGGSFEAFCAIPECSVRRLYEWVGRHKDFQQAKELGEDLARKFWEDLGKAGQAGQLKTKTSQYKFTPDGKKVLIRETEHPANFNASAWIFMMKNRYGWRDKQDVDHTVKTSPTDLSKLTEEELRALGAELAKLIQG